LRVLEATAQAPVQPSCCPSFSPLIHKINRVKRRRWRGRRKGKLLPERVFSKGWIRLRWFVPLEKGRSLLRRVSGGGPLVAALVLEA